MNNLAKPKTEQEVARKEQVKAEIETLQQQVTKERTDLTGLQKQNQEASQQASRLKNQNDRNNERADERTLDGKLKNIAVDIRANDINKEGLDVEQQRRLQSERRSASQAEEVIIATRKLDYDKESLNQIGRASCRERVWSDV